MGKIITPQTLQSLHALETIYKLFSSNFTKVLNKWKSWNICKFFNSMINDENNNGRMMIHGKIFTWSKIKFFASSDYKNCDSGMILV